MCIIVESKAGDGFDAKKVSTVDLIKGDLTEVFNIQMELYQDIGPYNDQEDVDVMIKICVLKYLSDPLPDIELIFDIDNTDDLSETGTAYKTYEISVKDDKYFSNSAYPFWEDEEGNINNDEDFDLNGLSDPRTSDDSFLYDLSATMKVEYAMGVST